MKTTLVLATLLTTLTATSAFASGNCNVPENMRQPVEALQTQLEAKGMQVRQIKIEDGCYEAYTIDASGNRAEMIYNPQTLMAIGTENGEDKGDDKSGENS